MVIGDALSGLGAFDRAVTVERLIAVTEALPKESRARIIQMTQAGPASQPLAPPRRALPFDGEAKCRVREHRGVRCSNEGPGDQCWSRSSDSAHVAIASYTASPSASRILGSASHHLGCHIQAGRFRRDAP